MKIVECYTPQDSGYEDVCRFAQSVYTEEISLRITRYPDVLFAITDDSQVFGCMGLNTDLHFPLFLNDQRLLRIISESRADTRFCEQSILALNKCSMGLPILISVVANFAQNLGLHKVVYAAISVSKKTIQDLGFDAIEYGNAELALLPQHLQEIYACWHRMYNPVCCLLDTANAPIILDRVMSRFSKKIKCGNRLKQGISLH